MKLKKGDLVVRKRRGAKENGHLLDKPIPEPDGGFGIVFEIKKVTKTVTWTPNPNYKKERLGNKRAENPRFLPAEDQEFLVARIHWQTPRKVTKNKFSQDNDTEQMHTDLVNNHFYAEKTPDGIIYRDVAEDGEVL